MTARGWEAVFMLAFLFWGREWMVTWVSLLDGDTGKVSNGAHSLYRHCQSWGPAEGLSLRPRLRRSEVHWLGQFCQENSWCVILYQLCFLFSLVQSEVLYFTPFILGVSLVSAGPVAVRELTCRSFPCSPWKNVSLFSSHVSWNVILLCLCFCHLPPPKSNCCKLFSTCLF